VRSAPAIGPWPALLAGCLALAALTLLYAGEPTYDPYSWIIWGREIGELALDTTGGPSWKPLPVLFTTPFSLAGDAAPALWVLVARAGGLLALAMAYRLAARLAGPAAGVVAAAALLLGDEFVRNFALGNSEGLLVAVCLWAIERHLDGHRRDTFLLLVAAALLRPEVWPFFGLYGLWLGWAEPARRWLVAGGFAAVVALWFGPEWWGSGNPLRAAERARHANPDSAAYADLPFVEVFRRSGHILAIPVLAGAVAGIALAWRERRGLALVLAGAAALLMVAVAAMTQAGFAGNLRYVALPAALVCVLAGVGWVGLLAAARERAGARAAVIVAVVALAASVPLLDGRVAKLADDVQEVQEEDHLYTDLSRIVDRAGGPGAFDRCGAVYATRFETPPIAWRLERHISDVDIFPEGPGSILARRPSALELDPRYPVVTKTALWTVGRRCVP